MPTLYRKTYILYQFNCISDVHYLEWYRTKAEIPIPKYYASQRESLPAYAYAICPKWSQFPTLLDC